MGTCSSCEARESISSEVERLKRKQNCAPQAPQIVAFEAASSHTNGDNLHDHRQKLAKLTTSKCASVEAQFVDHRSLQENIDPGSHNVPISSDPCDEELTSAVIADSVQEDRSARTSLRESAYLWTEPSQTLNFLDWDDTLFPTTHMFYKWKVPFSVSAWDSLNLTDAQLRSLDEWQDALFAYMRILCTLTDRLCILTNAEQGWVEKCITRFAPRLQTYFKGDGGPRVVYAREYGAAMRLLPGSPRGNPTIEADAEGLAKKEKNQYWTKVKLLAMQKQAKDFYSQYPDQTWKNILSIGDARYEHDAARDLGFRRRSPSGERLRVKSIRTPSGPRLKDLTYRLKLAALVAPIYVKWDDDLDFDMHSPDRLHVIADTLHMPELKSVIRATVLHEEDDAALEAEYNELTNLLHNR